ncbi:hypothetical protein [Litchfieldia alkalitelluris]|uniref:hypothetical protein n=1 Tax=Litchfieldia alkalitelluris TaxID=304268 RepID=UPI000998A26F|nr:hypothetical protein [Litchfieldia alkalitelluris]
MRIHVLLFSFILIILSTGCSLFHSSSLEGSSFEIPQGYIETNEKKETLHTGGFHIERKVGLSTEVTTTDAASPNQIAETISPILVGSGDIIEITTDIKDSTLIAYLWNEDERDQEIILKNNQMKAPVEKGQYVYEILSRWGNNEVSYTFLLEVK